MPNDHLVSATGISGGSNISIPYGPWPGWGQPVEVTAKANPMPLDRGDIKYSAWIRIARTARGTETLKDPSDPASYTNGDSHIALDPGLDHAIRVNLGQEAPFALLRPNADGRLSYIELLAYSTPTIDAAVNLARITVNSAALLLPVATKVPIYWDAMLVRADDKLQIRVEYNAPYPAVPLASLDDVWMQPSLLRFAQVFAEGLRSESPFYRFLSFFKVAQQVNAAVRPQLRKLCEDRVPRSGVRVTLDAGSFSARNDG